MYADVTVMRLGSAHFLHAFALALPSGLQASKFAITAPGERDSSCYSYVNPVGTCNNLSTYYQYAAKLSFEF
ncbi:hypothetical protein GQ44DRAFT_427470 [Phaeosphaeriaceae sp. PMI808]|nr:hypothetical protein GQ44DRAFT_427470 [Phaeosphaeriaceae sp. PMI808]